MKKVLNTKKIISVSIITIFILCIFGNFNIKRANATVDLTFLNSYGSNDNLDTYTFSSKSLGTAADDRVIIVNIATRAAGATTKTIDSVTIGGVAATVNVQVQYNLGNTTVVGIASALVPTGTTGDVVVTMNAAVARMGIGMYRATGLADHTTVYDSDSSITAGGAVYLDIPAGGFAIGVGALYLVTGSATWTGLTEDYDASVESTMISTGASDTFATAQTGLELGVSFSGGSEPAAAYASWAEAPPSVVKTIRGLLRASVKTINGMALGSIKRFNGTQ